MPKLHKSSSSHLEAEAVLGKDIRNFSVGTKSFEGINGIVTKINCIKLDWIPQENGGFPKMQEIPGSEFSLAADIVLFAMGFLHPEHTGILEQLGVEFDARGNVKTDSNYSTNIDKVFSAGDMRKGQSLVVHAIAEGRNLAEKVDKYLINQ